MEIGQAEEHAAKLLLLALNGGKAELPKEMVDKFGASVRGNSVVFESHPFVNKIEVKPNRGKPPTISMLMHRLVISHDDFQANLNGEAETVDGLGGKEQITGVFERQTPFAVLSKLMLKEDLDEKRNTLTIEPLENDKGKVFKLRLQNGAIIIEAKPGAYLRLTPSNTLMLRRTIERHEWALKKHKVG